MTSMPRSKSSSASEGVIPNPAAAFSQLAMTTSTECWRTSSGKRSFVISLPGRPKMSPMKRMFKIRSQVLGLRLQGCAASWSANPASDGNTLKIARSAGAIHLLAADFGRLQEVIISRGIQRQVAHAPGVHQYVVEKPEIDVGQVGSQD